ncbi:Adenosylcobalamin/alpha-ribazole phosphatase [Madurella mycetomatis]|uniref:Adenosylcobalamin/alpha-ribazole phosphatase n=1 Tax=Madurella mycetomatis TaxID=100816 RepID=A0A175W429_9PEZI|nr:Adenosylcobalamin/alpha-ribazole phosphatase [Madurella mycetomatis]
MRLFLVRHGETVDNVAGIYAGTRDSPLTSHGILQAGRLASHLASLGPAKHIFSSDLQRAVETARAIVDAQPAPLPTAAAAVPQLIQLPELRERDFGTAEGKKFGVSLSDAGMETRAGMRKRAESFVQGWLEPLLSEEESEGAVVVVAHGLILGELLAVLLARFGSGLRDPVTAWSNTGYTELVVEARLSLAEGVEGEGEAAPNESMPPVPPLRRQQQRQISMSVVGINVVKHLEGLKKTRGGIGSARFDKRQRTMESFFAPATKKQRSGDT